jgi:ferrochelatase
MSQNQNTTMCQNEKPKSPKIGVLLCNIGTPHSYAVRDVRRYLKEFLWDPRVIDIPAWARFLLLYVFILPFRPKKSATLYKKIWGPRGSPLLSESLDLVKEVQAQLGNNYVIKIGMRYQEPSLEQAWKSFSQDDPEQVLVVPLYPQYSTAATASVFDKMSDIFKQEKRLPRVGFLPSFYDAPEFLDSLEALMREHLPHIQDHFLLFSYHGLPERQIKACDVSQTHCLQQENCCENPPTPVKRFCYRAQCLETSRILATRLGLSQEVYMTSFQSRLGRTPWIAPYTDILVQNLRKKGIMKLAVVCPSFVTDCLETLEEVNIRLREQWQSLGGTDFYFIPCLNHSAPWVQGLSQLIRKHAP